MTHHGKRFGALVSAALLLAALSLAGCQERRGGPGEQAGKDVDQAVEKAGKQIEKAGDKLQDAARGDGK